MGTFDNAMGDASAGPSTFDQGTPAHHSEGGLLGMLKEGASLIANAPQGFGHFVENAFVDPAGGALLGGTIGSFVPIPGVGTGIGALIGAGVGGLGDVVRHAVDPSAPWSETVQGYKATAEHIAHPSDYITAYGQGHFVGMLTSDLANIASIAGPAAHGVTGTGEAAVRGAEQSAQAAEKAMGEAAATLEQTGNAAQAARQAATASPGSDPTLGAALNQAQEHLSQAEAAHSAAQSAHEAAQATAQAARQAADSLAAKATRVNRWVKLANDGAFAPYAPWVGLKKIVTGGDVFGSELKGLVPKLAEKARAVEGEGKVASAVRKAGSVDLSAEGALQRIDQHRAAMVYDQAMARTAENIGKMKSDAAVQQRFEEHLLPDPADQHAAILVDTVMMPADAAGLRTIRGRLRASGEPGAWEDVALPHMAERANVSPEGFERAMDVLDPYNTDPQIENLRGRIATYSDHFRGVTGNSAAYHPLAANRYAVGYGEMDPSKVPTAEQAQWAEHGTTPSPDALAAVSAKYQPKIDRARFQRDQAQAALERIAGRADPSLPEHTASMVGALGVATKVAEAWLGTPHDTETHGPLWDMLASSDVPVIRRLGERAKAGLQTRLDALDLRDRIIEWAAKGKVPGGDPVAQALTEAFTNNGGDATSAALVPRLGPEAKAVLDLGRQQGASDEAARMAATAQESADRTAVRRAALTDRLGPATPAAAIDRYLATLSKVDVAQAKTKAALGELDQALTDPARVDRLTRSVKAGIEGERRALQAHIAEVYDRTYPSAATSARDLPKPPYPVVNESNRAAGLRDAYNHLVEGGLHPKSGFDSTAGRQSLDAWADEVTPILTRAGFPPETSAEGGGNRLNAVGDAYLAYELSRRDLSAARTGAIKNGFDLTRPAVRQALDDYFQGEPVPPHLLGPIGDAVAGQVRERATSWGGMLDDTHLARVADALHQDADALAAREPTDLARAPMPGRAALDPAEGRYYDALVASFGQRAAEGAASDARGFIFDLIRRRETVKAQDAAQAEAVRQTVQVAKRTGDRAAALAAKALEPAGPGLDAAGRLSVAALRQIGGIQRHAGVMDQRVAQSVREVGIREKHLARLDGNLQADLERAKVDINNAPQPYRVPLRFAEKMNGSLGDIADELDSRYGPEVGDALRAEQVTFTKDLAQAVRENPDFEPIYLHGGAAPVRSPKGGSMNLTPEMMPTTRTARSQRGVKSGAHVEMTPAGLWAAFLADQRTRAMNQAAMQIGSMLGTTPERVFAGQQDLLDQYQAWRDTPKGVTRTNGSRQIIAEMGERGLVPWDPRSQSNTGRVGAEGLTNETVWIPESVWRQYHRANMQVWDPNGKVEQNLKRFVDTPTRIWKHSVLALRPAWQVGNIAGNMIMAGVAGGIDPLTLAFQWRKAAAVLRHTDLQTLMDRYHFTERELAGLQYAKPSGSAATPSETIPMTPAGLLQRGEVSADIVHSGMALPDESPVVHREDGKVALGATIHESVRHPLTFSYEMNGFIDDVNRLAIYLTKIDRGYTGQERAQYAATRPDVPIMGPDGTPALPRAAMAAAGDPGALEHEMAVAEALRIAGQFSKMTPIERYVVRRVLPFYAWLRHITKLSGYMVAHHPLRVAWALKFGSMADENSDVPLVWGAIPLGGDHFLKLPNINPFLTVTDMLFPDHQNLNPGLGLLSSVNPLAATVSGLATGWSPRDMGAVTSAPPGVALDAYGRASYAPLFTHPVRSLDYLTNQLPQLQLLKQAVPDIAFGHAPVLRDATGLATHVSGEPIPADENYVAGYDLPGRAQFAGGLRSMLGLGQEQAIDVAAIRDRAAARQRTQAAAVRRYFGGSGAFFGD